MRHITGLIFPEKLSWTGNTACLILVGILITTSCSVTKTLDEDERLYTGGEIEIIDKSFWEKPGLKGNVKKQVKPDPNGKFLGLYPLKLGIYNMLGDSVPDKGFKHWLQEKLGEEPVIYDDNYVQQSENDIKDYLYEHGYFDATAESRVQAKGKKVSVKYIVETGTAYKIDSITFPDTTTALKKNIDSTRSESLLKVGNDYNFQQLLDERARINAFLQNRGYYYFTPDYLLFEIDSSSGTKELYIDLTVKDNIPERSREVYRINDIVIHSDYSLGDTLAEKDTLRYQDKLFIYETNNVNPSVVANSLMFKEGDLYSYDNYVNSLNKLSGLGIYKFSNIKFNHVEGDSSLLNSEVFLTQSVPKSIRVELQAVTKSNDYAGPKLALRYTDRNFTGGAERFSANISTSFETQISDTRNAGNLYEIGLEADYAVPRFIFPFVDLNKYLSKKYTPRTYLRGGYTFYFRTNYFRMNTFNARYGYTWRESKTNRHDLQLINFSYSRLKDRTEEFEEILESNELIRQSFSEELILSLDYKFIHNGQVNSDRAFTTYFSVNPELAGNILSLYYLARHGHYPDPESPGELLGVKYSQYARLQIDQRFYYDLGEKSKLAARLLGGIGAAYGNSNVLPYTRQFYMGGASDLRAFRTHTVGPGQYNPPDTSFNTYFEQVGDIKLEANLEYRFGIINILKGAVFLDAGNVWLLKKDAQKPEGVFHWDRFVEDLALGSGFGLRLDASVFVLRFDVGIPLRKPWLPQGERWIYQNIDFSSSSWRRKNLVLNIAIGYPF